MSRLIWAFGVLATVMSVATSCVSVYADHGPSGGGTISNELCTGGTTCEGRGSGTPGVPATCNSNPEPCAPNPGTTACACGANANDSSKCGCIAS